MKSWIFYVHIFRSWPEKLKEWKKEKYFCLCEESFVFTAIYNIMYFKNIILKVFSWKSLKKKKNSNQVLLRFCFSYFEIYMFGNHHFLLVFICIFCVMCLWYREKGQRSFCKTKTITVRHISWTDRKNIYIFKKVLVNFSQNLKRNDRRRNFMLTKYDILIWYYVFFYYISHLKSLEMITWWEYYHAFNLHIYIKELIHVYTSTTCIRFYQIWAFKCLT